ncbi:MAG TPA: MetQ/NlpA family ABC transporter substrate-binding protein [Bacillales bacterium]
MRNLKKLFSITIVLLLAVGLAACGSSSSASGGQNSGNAENSNDNGKGKEELTTLTVGATPVPHAVILKKAKPILKKKGIKLEIVKFEDYVTPNKALATGDLDANYFQHLPYLKKQKENFGYNFVSVGKIHIEPIAGYSKKYDSVEELPKGATVLLPSVVPAQSRILTLLDHKGIIKLKEDAGYDATFEDIVENPKELNFKHDIKPALLPQAYKHGEGDLVFINTNYAIDNGLNPLEDSIIIEGKDSPYANVVAVKKENADNPAIQTLVDVLQSKKIQQFILDKWNGSVVPVSLNK